MEAIGVAAFLIGLVVLALFVNNWMSSRSRQLINQWAEANGYQIVSAEYCWLRRGPFFWTTNSSQTVYRVTVVDSSGRSRSGWARCGSRWKGLRSDRVDVRWDGER